ncbi:hypothetical protein JX266_011800 [Neoarthrinium moseri]|nr:hypothetical protein JX266_011800 [Neoarthrinium moseri]
MAEGSKAGENSAARAFQRHFDSHPAAQHDRLHGPSRSNDQRFASAWQNSNQANAEFLQHQMGRLDLESASRGSVSPIPSLLHGPGDHPLLHDARIRHHEPQHTGVPPAMHTAARDPFALGAQSSNINQAPMTSVAQPSTLPNVSQAHAVPAFGAHQFQPAPPGQPQFWGHDARQFNTMPWQPAALQQQPHALSQDLGQSMEHTTHEEIRAAHEADFDKAMADWMAQQATEEPVTDSTEASEQAAEPQEGPLGDNELARVAQQLVESVSSDESEKFRKSNFVDLMRRIAAQEVVIRDNNMVEASQTDSTAPAVFHSGAGSGAEHIPPINAADSKGKGKARAFPRSPIIESDDSM